MDKWHHLVAVRLVTQHRQGWPGVWDALKAAWTKDPRTVVQKPMTMELWAFGNYTDVTMREVPEQSPTPPDTPAESRAGCPGYIDGVSIRT